MADNQYKIQLGVDLKVDDIRDRITQYNQNKNNAKVKLGIKLDTSDLKEQINKLNLGGTGKGVAIPVNTQSLEASLKEVKDIIADIKAAMGTLDGGNMKSLLSSVNQIATALGKAENESDNLVKSLNALSKKDFSINVGIDMNKKNLSTIGYGRAARKQVIPELEAQIKYLENLFGGQQATMNKLTSQGKNVGFDIFTDFGDFNSDSAIKKMEAMEKYINSLKKLATINNVDLDGFNEIHKDASALINDITGIENVVDKAGDVPEKLKNLFGGSIDGEGLSKQLDSIVTDLSEIKTAIQGLSQNNAIDGLIQSFNKLSETLDKLMSNAKLVKDVLGGVSSGANTGVGDGLDKQAQQAQQSAKEIQQAAKQTTDAYNQIAKGASTLSQLEPLKGKEAVNEAEELAVALSKLKNIQSNIKKIDIGNVDTSKGVQELKTLEKQLESLSAEYNETVAKINSKGGVSATQFQSVQNEIKNTELKLEQLRANLVKKIQINLSDKGANGFEAKVENIRASIKKLKQPTDVVKAAFKDLNNALNAMNYASEKGDIQGLIDAHINYQEALKVTQSYLKQNQQAEKQNYDAESLSLKKTKALQQIQIYLQGNTRAARVLGDEFRDLAKDISACDDSKALDHLLAKLQNLTIKASGISGGTKTFADKFKKQWQQYSSYLSVASLFQYGEQALRSMFEQVKLIDSAMTELKKVTNETDAAYEKFLTNAASRAREIGTTIDGLVSSTADFARLGYGFEDAQGLAEVANIYAVVGDEIEGVEGATESLISTMAAFKDEMNGMSNTDFAMSIIDKFNEIGNNFAISSGGIGEALERSASSLMAANNTIDESIALITAANTVVQDPEQVGKAYADYKSGYIG